MARRGASRGAKGSSPALLWLFSGILIGLGLAWYLATKGWIAMPEATPPESTQARPGSDEAPLADQLGGGENDRTGSKYDFFTVLPEMEVVVPEQELSRAQQPEQAATPAASGDGSYVLQVGSFRSSGDADQMKARLALLGFGANVQQVTVNGETWHRVRIGPVAGAAEANDIRNRLSQGGIDSLVMKNP